MKDKTLLKTAGILGIVFGILFCITIIGIIIGIPMIIGGYKLNSYSDLKDEEIINYESSILGWSIFFIIFSIIPGILSLVYYIGLTSEDTILKSKSNNIEELEKLKKLYDDRVITKEEFENKKKEILERI